ncbi:MAG: prolyl oligopeptidase family serine peptidase [Chloroflexi bacterium]|nr:prolyl oligopeptidase family serine peptidase [Chloroflexota bacterium]
MSKAYGAWKSPISGAAIASGLSLRDAQWDAAGETLVWWENREKVGVLVAQTGWDAPRDLTDASLNVAGAVGYGGGAFTVGAGSVVFATKNRLYRQSLAGGVARAISPAFGACAAPALSADGNWVAYAHSYEHEDGLLIVDAEGAHFPRRLAFGTDFVMQPIWHPAGRHIAFVAWNHPQMPWNGSELRLIELATDGSEIPYAQDIVTLAGDTETAIFQPAFSPDGRYLAYISDASGWGQVYLYDLETQQHSQLTQAEAEHGTPAWAQGMRSYGWSGDSRAIYVLRNDRAFFSLQRCDVASGECETVAGLDDYSEMEQVSIAPKTDKIAMIASSSLTPPRVISLHRAGRLQVHRRRGTENLGADQLSAAQAITWQGDDGDVVHGLYYPPVLRDEQPPGAPPLIVNIHGGPTSQRCAGYYSEVQFFTTRGYAVLQVNHRGGTGYGKAYMDMHRGNWGVYDVSDSLAGVRHLATAGLVDGDKAVIMGGSSGGFTVLQSLVEHPGFYKAGICSYGVSNQFGLLMDTHKFEERYTYWLLGKLPEAAALYRERSPVFHADQIVDPIIVFQGTDDVVVPQDQSDSIVASLKRRGIPHEYHLFAGEGHGWRQATTIETYYKSIERFLLQHVIYA